MGAAEAFFGADDPRLADVDVRTDASAFTAFTRYTAAPSTSVASTKYVLLSFSPSLSLSSFRFDLPSGRTIGASREARRSASAICACSVGNGAKIRFLPSFVPFDLACARGRGCGRSLGAVVAERRSPGVETEHSVWRRPRPCGVRIRGVLDPLVSGRFYRRKRTHFLGRIDNRLVLILCWEQEDGAVEEEKGSAGGVGP